MDASAATARLDRIAAKAASHRDAAGVRFAVRMPGFEWSWLHPDAKEQYFVASVTKLVTAAIVLQHIDESRYDLDTPAVSLLPQGTMDGLHGGAGVDRSALVTVRHLLGHTSGIADYFEGARMGQRAIFEEMLRGDLAWTHAEALDIVRGRTPDRDPGDHGRAFYSDTNYQLLHLVIDGQDGSFEDAVARRVCDPLGLEDTYAYSADTLARYDQVQSIHYGEGPLELRHAMASFGADGGLVSTAEDQLDLLDAIMGARLFSPQLLDQATGTWRPLFFPLEYGLGAMRYRLPRAFSPLSPMPALIGHSGATGSVLFHDPARQLTIAGSINQLRRRSQVFKVLWRLERALR
ncbi:serine hydrolase domain-containing protein [Demequina activiva]|uniref:Channel forming colicins domain-containing protein n=1 Tax=Demequina activiva TaxID=1582364 RepID=A0A919Q2P5_9MICO|nr:serine hydrolase domain-containing protein [Demequina activiva]GIG55147.1 hypothetical protein Dac01nite_18990 [Demequina activiva]